MRPTVAQKGPSLGEWNGQPIPEYIVTGRGRFTFARFSDPALSGGFATARLKPDEVLIAPGLIYRRDSKS